jgi:hypothetical protein
MFFQEFVQPLGLLDEVLAVVADGYRSFDGFCGLPQIPETFLFGFHYASPAAPLSFSCAYITAAKAMLD